MTLSAVCLTLAVATTAVAVPGQNAPSGEEFFAEHCATCPGCEGSGNGPLAAVLTVRPAEIVFR